MYGYAFFSDVVLLLSFIHFLYLYRCVVFSLFVDVVIIVLLFGTLECNHYTFSIDGFRHTYFSEPHQKYDAKNRMKKKKSKLKL